LEVLHDENFNFGLKLNILKKAFPDKINKKIEEKIRRLMRIRNIYAHNHNIKIYKGEKWVVINPRNFNSGYTKAKDEGKVLKVLTFKNYMKNLINLLMK
jgi:hypothetical protein